MSPLARFALLLVFMASWAAIYFIFRDPAASETRDLKCTFKAEQASSQATYPLGSRIEVIEYRAELSGKSDHDDITLWSAHGVTSFGDLSQDTDGAVFVGKNGSVRGVMLYRAPYPQQATDLRISTLDDGGQLDWNERSAFVYFENAPDKMAHSYRYRCDLA